MRLSYLSCSKWCPSATVYVWTWDCTRCTLYNKAGDTLAQASAIRFRISCNVSGEIAYTLCLYHDRKKSYGFRSGEREDHSTQPPYLMICCWNVSRRYCWTLDTLCGGAPLCWNYEFRRSLNGRSSTTISVISIA